MTTDPVESQSRLIAEQLGHTLDLIKAEINSLHEQQAHQAEMNTLRLNSLEIRAADYEKRLRDLTDSATQFKLLVSLALGGGLLSLIALLRSLSIP